MAKYLVFNDKLEAEKAMSDVWETYKADMISKGFEVINNEIVPINAATGEPDYTAQRTIAWDIPIETKDGKFAIGEPPAHLKTRINPSKFSETTAKLEFKEKEMKVKAG